MKPIVYRYYLQVGAGAKTLAHPIVKDDTSLEMRKDSGQMYFRTELSGKVDFVRDDYTLIMSANYDDIIYFYIEISTDFGLTYADYWQGKFVRTDCEINADDKIISVNPDVVDDYNDIIKGIDKEFNLIELAPEIERLMVTKRPCIQTYIPGDSIVNCFVSGSSWEVDVTDEITDTDDLVNTYLFSLNTILKEIEVTTTDGDTNAVGTYSGRITKTSNTVYSGTLTQQNGGSYYITVDSQNLSWGGEEIHWGVLTVTLYDGNDTALYEYTQTNGAFDTKTFTFSAVNGTGTMTGSVWTYNVFARLLCDVEDINGTATSKIPSADIVTNNLNYQRAVGYAVNIAYISNQYDNDPTEYGRRDDGLYFAPPFSVSGDKFFPIAQSTWHYSSLWFRHSYADEDTEKYGRKVYVLRDAYPLASCISVLLAQIAPNITHQATTAYSEFLYSGTNPVSNQKMRLYVTQKSNILKGEYTTPAKKAETTLNDFLKMLCSAFDCYWFIDNGKLRIEHVSWFRNGGSYASNIKTTSYDLTTLKDIRSSKLWENGQRKYTYDKVDLPERYEYGWMDETTRAFDGYPIEILANNVEDGKIEDVNVGNFTSDVDYMLLNPSACSEDGFALMSCTLANALILDDSEGYYPGFYGSSGTFGQNNNYSTPLYPIVQDYIGQIATLNFECSGNGTGYLYAFDSTGTPTGNWLHRMDSTETTAMFTIPDDTAYLGVVMDYDTLDFNFFSLEVYNQYGLPFVSLTIDGVNYKMQNGYMAMVNLQPNYLTYQMPARNINVNTNDTTANGIMQKMKQTLTFPADAVNVDTNKLVKTSVGFGTIDTINLNLCSRQIKGTLVYDTDIQ